MISLQNVSYAVKNSVLVNDVSVQIAPGEFVVIMGANGAGKSTLLKLMSGALQPATGNIIFKNKELSQYKAEPLAKLRAVLSQHYHISFPMKARDIVMMGRYPYFNSHPSPTDEQMVTAAMEKMEVLSLAGRNYQTLSGGEAQKIQMCRVMAQIGLVSADEPKLLLLDEPVSHLDIKYQHQLLQQAKNCCETHVAVVAVLHDINLALKYADRILFMKEGILVHTYAKRELLSEMVLQDVFDIAVKMYQIPGKEDTFAMF